MPHYIRVNSAAPPAHAPRTVPPRSRHHPTSRAAARRAAGVASGAAGAGTYAGGGIMRRDWEVPGLEIDESKQEMPFVLLATMSTRLTASWSSPTSTSSIIDAHHGLPIGFLTLTRQPPRAPLDRRTGLFLLPSCLKTCHAGANC